MSQQLRRNKISIELTLNNYYAQLPKSQRDVSLIKQVLIAPMQIKKVEIFKSYDEHVTDVVVEVDNLDPNVAAYWSEGKYIANLSIIAETPGDTKLGFENYFACFDLRIINTPAFSRNYATNTTVSAKVVLKSITRTRLEIENNFTYELGGKNGKGAAGVGQAPIQFLNSTLMEMYSRNYMEAGEEGNIPWNMTYCDLIEPVHQIHTTPSNGFKMITDTNMQTLEYFFKHYPVFNTTYDWMLDDFNTSDGGDKTELRITDLTWWPAWEEKIDANLSAIMNKEIEGAENKEAATITALRFFKIQQIEHIPYYDWVVFYVKNGYPKIWAVDVSSGKPIPMVAWNGIHEEAPVLTPSGNIKKIKNPMYREYLTFMTQREIVQSQLFLNVFQNLHPHLEKFTFSNVFIGEIDIHTVVEFKLEDTEDPGKYDRLGMGYQVLHTYTREDLQPKNYTGVTSSSNDDDPVNSQFSYSHALVTDIVFLTIDKGELDIASMGNEDAVNVSEDPGDYTPSENDPCAGATDTGGTPGGTTGGSDGVGIPGNTSISDQALALYNQKFKYLWNGKRLSQGGLDCSGYTTLAVTRAGVGGYPHGTTAQRKWCNRHAQKIDSTANAKAGDVLFFGYGDSYGHTGIAIGGGQFVHSSGGSSNTINNLGKGASKGSYATYSAKNTLVYRLKG